MKYRPIVYREFIEEPTLAKVIDVKIREKEKQVGIDWTFTGGDTTGTATSCDGVHYKGEFKEKEGFQKDRGTFEFTLYSDANGRKLLLGTWQSTDATERQFMIVLAADTTVQ